MPHMPPTPPESQVSTELINDKVLGPRSCSEVVLEFRLALFIFSFHSRAGA